MKKLYRVTFKKDTEVQNFLVECVEHFGDDYWEPTHVPSSLVGFLNDGEDEEENYVEEEETMSEDEFYDLLSRYKKLKKLYLQLEANGRWTEEAQSYIESLLKQFESNTGISRYEIDYFEWSPFLA